LEKIEYIGTVYLLDHKYPEPLLNTIDISVSNLIDNYQTDLNFYLVQANN